MAAMVGMDMHQVWEAPEQGGPDLYVGSQACTKVRGLKESSYCCHPLPARLLARDTQPLTNKVRFSKQDGALTKLGITHVLSIGAKMLTSEVDTDAGMP
jgi:hypothetical protein